MAADLESVIKPHLFSVTQKLSDAIRLRLIEFNLGLTKQHFVTLSRLLA